MPKKRESFKITYPEMLELWDAGLVIKAHFDGMIDGWSYSLHKIGDWDHSIAWKKSPRACYNAAKKSGNLTMLAPDKGQAAVVKDNLGSAHLRVKPAVRRTLRQR